MPSKHSMGLYSNLTKKLELIISERFKLIYIVLIKINYTKNVLVCFIKLVIEAKIFK